MKQVLQYRRSGKTRVVDVPSPVPPSGGVLLRNRWSLISPGTERMVVEAGGANLAKTARDNPRLVKQVLDKARREGPVATLQTVWSRIDVTIPLGYSCAGYVVEASPDTGYSEGDRVACAGAGQANHAEFVAVKKNLTVRVPDAVGLDDAAFVTVGAIALQGVRVADVRVGESCVVIGLGLVGQLTVQLLKAAGCRVFGIDVADDKVSLARELGADEACVRSEATLVEQVKAFSNGRGADAILIAAATTSSDPIELAPSLARDRAVVAAVGAVGMDVPRNAYYEKELDLRLSRSYGPGRYDATYEDRGVDYPVGYVRWTEQRNMEAFLQLVAEGRVHPSRLVTHRVPIHEAERAYDVVTGETGEPYLGILLDYPEESQPCTSVQIAPSKSRPRRAGAVRVGFVGAGNFARATLLPALTKMGNRVELRSVATASGPSAHQTASRFHFPVASTDWRAVVEDPDIDAVVVATRHNLHARVAEAALRAGKAVFLEKPMALDEEGLQEVMTAWMEAERPLLVGFNRRFSPSVHELRRLWQGRTTPLVLNYRVNAGAVAPGSWVADPVEGGGRLLGEVCHMVDLLHYLTDARVKQVFAQGVAGGQSGRDDLILSLQFADGSLGSIVYASGGDRGQPKERLEILGGGQSAILDDFVRVSTYQGGSERVVWQGTQDKGHAIELQAFIQAVAEGSPSPIHPADSAHVTRVTFAALESLQTASAMDMLD